MLVPVVIRPLTLLRAIPDGLASHALHHILLFIALRAGRYDRQRAAQLASARAASCEVLIYRSGRGELALFVLDGLTTHPTVAADEVHLIYNQRARNIGRFR